MKTEIIEIVNRGRGPQLSTSRITVLDIFYYLHRGHAFDVIHEIMPTLSREEFDLVVEYVKAHHDELVEKDRRAEEFIRRGIEEQQAKGLCPPIDESVPLEERIARLKMKIHQQPATEKRRLRMNSLLMNGVVRNGRVEVDEPIPFPDGTEVIVTPKSDFSEDDGPMTPEEIARVLAAMAKIQPFDMTPEEEAEIEAGRQKIKAYTIANMNKGIEDLFP